MCAELLQTCAHSYSCRPTLPIPGRNHDGTNECKLSLKCDGTPAETKFRLLAKRTSPFKSAGGVSSVDYWQPSCANQRQ